MLVKFNAKRVLGFGDHLIIPGINDLPEEVVSDMMDDSIISAKFDDGELEILDKEDLGVKAKKGKDLSGVELLLAASEKNAKDLAAQTVDMKILKKWINREKRAVVRKAVRAQIDKIRNIKFREEKDKQKLEKSKDDEE